MLDAISSPQPKPVLVVDDQDFMLTLLRRFLEGQGYRVDCAREREEAEALLQHRPYAAVVADLGLTTVNPFEGLDLVDFARYRQPQAKVIVLTGQPDELEAESLRRGAHAFLGKPVRLPELATTLEGLVGR